MKHHKDDDYHFSKFLIPYLIGLVFIFVGTLFLVGVKAQFSKMFEKKRIIPTIITLVAIVLTIVFAVAVKSSGLIMFMLVI